MLGCTCAVWLLVVQYQIMLFVCACWSAFKRILNSFEAASRSSFYLTIYLRSKIGSWTPSSSHI